LVAAIQLKAPFNAGYQIKKTITPVEQANKALPAGSYTRSEVLRITLVRSQADDTRTGWHISIEQQAPSPPRHPCV
jgi:hypothetical protein